MNLFVFCFDIKSLNYESKNLTLFKKNSYQLPMALISGNNFVFHSLSLPSSLSLMHAYTTAFTDQENEIGSLVTQGSNSLFSRA